VNELAEKVLAILTSEIPRFMAEGMLSRGAQKTGEDLSRLNPEGLQRIVNEHFRTALSLYLPKEKAERLLEEIQGLIR